MALNDNAVWCGTLSLLLKHALSASVTEEGPGDEALG